MTEFWGSQHSVGAQIHWYGTFTQGVPLADIFHIQLDNWNDANGAYRHDSHHIYGNGGGDVYAFEQLDLLGNRTTGRLDTFDPTRDVIQISGVTLSDLSALPDTIAGVRVSVVSFLDQQWLRLQTANGSALFTLESARMTANVEANLGDWTGEVERHFNDITRAQIDALPEVTYVNPNNFVPYHLYEAREAGLNHIQGNTATVTGTGADDFVFAVKYSLPSDMGGMAEHGSQLIDLGAGNDVVQANTGNDTVFGGDGNDAIAGGVDNDELHGDAGNDTLFGGDQNDWLFGGAGNDWLDGGRHADRLDGGEGDDYLNGGAGNDQLIGGWGRDTLEGGEGADRIFGWAGNDILSGGAGDDFLRGDNGYDRLDGGAGNDLLYGGNGGDALLGGAGWDRLFGGDGNDFLNGAMGNDVLTGGSGADRFYHTGLVSFGSDQVRDYSAAEGDVLVFSRATATADQFDLRFVNGGAGDASVAEAYVIYTPTGQALWRLVDGAAQDHIWLSIGGHNYDLMA